MTGRELTGALLARAGEIGLARVFPIAAVSMGSQGETLTDFHALTTAGAVALLRRREAGEDSGADEDRDGNRA